MNPWQVNVTCRQAKRLLERCLSTFMGFGPPDVSGQVQKLRVLAKRTKPPRFLRDPKKTATGARFSAWEARERWANTDVLEAPTRAPPCPLSQTVAGARLSATEHAKDRKYRRAGGDPARVNRLLEPGLYVTLSNSKIKAALQGLGCTVSFFESAMAFLRV